LLERTKIQHRIKSCHVPMAPYVRLFRAGADHARTPDRGGGTAKSPIAVWTCKGGPERARGLERRALLVVKGRIKGPMQMKTTVVVQEDDD